MSPSTVNTGDLILFGKTVSIFFERTHETPTYNVWAI